MLCIGYASKDAAVNRDDISDAAQNFPGTPEMFQRVTEYPAVAGLMLLEEVSADLVDIQCRGLITVPIRQARVVLVNIDAKVMACRIDSLEFSGQCA